MTLEEEGDRNAKSTRSCADDMIKTDAGMALREVLLDAKLEGRITYGVYESVRKLGSESDRVMLCIHADSNADQDVVLHIHFTLMEAFCRENGIRLLKVGCHESLAKLLCGDVNGICSGDKLDNDPTPSPIARATDDFVCLLVDFPEKMDGSTRCFLDHYNAMAQETPFPRISVAA